MAGFEVGQKFLDFVHPDDVERFAAEFSAQTASGDVARIEYRRRTKSGPYVWAEMIARLLRDAQTGETQEVLCMVRDISVRKQAEATVHESEARYRGLFSEMVAGGALHAIVCDASGRPVDYVTLEVNHGYETFLGVSREVVVGHLASETLPNDILERWLSIFGPVALTGQSVRYDMYSPLNRKHFECGAYCPVIGQFAVTFIDVTARREAEETLRASEKKYRELYESLTDAYAAVDLGGRITAFNAAFAQMIGFEPQAIHQLTVDDITPANWPWRTPACCRSAARTPPPRPTCCRKSTTG